MTASPGDRDAVAVVGGGWAGMAAAVTLAAAGVRVTVFEAARTLGGRARTIEKNGALLDNGQHLLLGAYRETLALIREVQPESPSHLLYLRMPLDLVGPGRFRLRFRRLPAPLHSLAGLLGAHDCSWAERIAVMRAFLTWKHGGWRCEPQVSVESLLHDQPATINARLWIPLCLAALNTPPGKASAQVFLNVVRDALAAGATASDMIVPRANLSQLFPEPAAQFVTARGGAVLRGTPVRQILRSGDRIALHVQGEVRYFGRAVVAAAAWQSVRLLEHFPAAAAIRAIMTGYSYQPITTVYLDYATPVRLPAPMIQLPGSPGQWAFERTSSPAGRSLLCVVISADGPHRKLDHGALVRAVRAQLDPLVKTGRTTGEPAWTQVITERRATCGCLPGLSRPPAGRIAAGLYLAGDHTDPDYPATLEAAVRSGRRAAAAVLEDR